jgi:hypothetical protein
MKNALVRALLSGALVLAACSDMEGTYFRQRVNEATQDAVGRRYGTPHKVDRLEDGRSTWTYYERGSGTSSFTGYAKSSYCRAYVLTFDAQGVLRDWREEGCRA